ncbi:MAG: hypothetical protein IAI50_14020 [Candidatus Eremiobacteraeota bacterium]|nr:hypothetical protein [Candidatus Eremiobacteraeota bacterium]
MLLRSAVSCVLLAALTAAPSAAGTTVARLTLQIPATPKHAARSLDVDSYTLDSIADFSLVRVRYNASHPGAIRVVVGLPASAPNAFATSGSASHFPWLTIRQASASGATLRRTVFYDVRVVALEPAQGGHRVTFAADRIDEPPVRSR